MVLVQRVLVFALSEHPVSDLSHFACDLERDLGLLADVHAVNRVLVFGVVLVHIAIPSRALVQRGVIRRELAAVCNDARVDRDVSARGLGVLHRANYGLAAEDLAEDDVLAVEMWRRVASDEELRAVRVCARVRLVMRSPRARRFVGRGTGRVSLQKNAP